MTFDQYWADCVARGRADTEADRAHAQDTWDSAICAASKACFGPDRKFLPSVCHVSDAIRHLHTWNKPSATLP